MWLYLGVWTFLAIIFAGQSVLYDLRAGVPVRWDAAFAASATYWYLWALLGIGVLWLSRTYRLTGERVRWHVAIHAVAGLFVAGAHVLLRGTAERLLSGRGADGFQTYFVEQFHLDLIVYWGLVGVTHALRFHRESVDQARETGIHAAKVAQLEALLASARLDALRAQLEPHFLFNSLQAVSTLMHTDVSLASQAMSRVTNLLRQVVDSADTHEVSLRDELRFAKTYLDIQQIRFEECLRVEMDIEEDALDAIVPTLILQPVIENACVHGILELRDGGCVRVTARTAPGEIAGAPRILELRVVNDAPPAPTFDAATVREGVGLANTRARLLALYGPAQHLRVARHDGTVDTLIKLPFRRDSRDADAIHHSQSATLPNE